MSISMRTLGYALLVVSMAGCASIVPQGDAPTLYNLTPKTTLDDGPEAEFQLVIEEPVASGGLDTSRIVLRPSPTRLEYFADARWTDRAPIMVQTVLIESFESSQRIVAVGRESIGLRSDYNLKLELREFQAEYFSEDEIPSVRVRINAKLVRQPRQEIIASRSFEEVRKTDADTLDNVIEGFDRSLGRVMKHLVGWALEQGVADQEGRL